MEVFGKLPCYMKCQFVSSTNGDKAFQAMILSFNLMQSVRTVVMLVFGTMNFTLPKKLSFENQTSFSCKHFLFLNIKMAAVHASYV